MKEVEEARIWSDNRLSALMRWIIDTEYNSLEELVAGADIYSVSEIHAFLNHILAAWMRNKLTPAAMYTLVKFAYLYLEQPGIHISYKNRLPIPICYFSSYLLSSASFLYSYMKTLGFDVALFPLANTDLSLRQFIEKERPPVVIFTISQFLHLHPFRQLIPYLQERNLKVFVGGIPFVYDESLKQASPGCIFPRDLNELTTLLENLLNGRGR